MIPPYYYNPYAPSSTQMHYSLPPTPVQPTYTTQFSDFIPEEQDLLEKLIACFIWLAARSPMQSAALNIAKDTLMKDEHIFKTLEKLSQAELEKTGIKPSIAMQLKFYFDLFKRKTMNNS